MPPRDQRREIRKKDMDMRATIMVDGVKYRFVLSDISARQELDLFQQSGLVLSKILGDIETAPAGFHVAALVYLARVSSGEKVIFDEIANHIGIAMSDIDIDLDEDEEDDLAPEVIGPDSDE